jgi:signal recognition particle GTPase
VDPFNVESFVSKLFGFGDVRGLMEAMKLARVIPNPKKN